MNQNGVVSDGSVSFGDVRDGIVSDVSDGLNNIRNGIDDGIDDLGGNSRFGANRSGDVSDDGLAGMDDANGSDAVGSGTDESRTDNSGTADSSNTSADSTNGSTGTDEESGRHDCRYYYCRARSDRCGDRHFFAGTEEEKLNEKTLCGFQIQKSIYG